MLMLGVWRTSPKSGILSLRVLQEDLTTKPLLKWEGKMFHFKVSGKLKEPWVKSASLVKFLLLKKRKFTGNQ